MKLVVFNDFESELIYNCLSVVTENHNDNDAQKIKANINSLIELVKAISQYPSIIATSNICGKSRSVETLMDLLKQKEGLDKILYTPTKAVLSKGFLIAKIRNKKKARKSDYLTQYFGVFMGYCLLQ